MRESRVFPLEVVEGSFTAKGYERTSFMMQIFYLYNGDDYPGAYISSNSSHYVLISVYYIVHKLYLNIACLCEVYLNKDKNILWYDLRDKGLL